MGWLWMCLGPRGKSARRIGGRVSSDTYLAPQYDPTKTPRIEDYLQPRRAGYDAFVNGHPPESPTSKPNNSSSTGGYALANGEKDLAAGHTGTHLYRRSMSESIKGEYGPYWGYSEDIPGEGFVSLEFPPVTPSTRKSFSELLIETDTLDKGPLALAAMAAAAERAARFRRLQNEGSSSASGIQIKEVYNAEGSQLVTLKTARNNSIEALEESLEVEGGAGGRKLVTDEMEAHNSQPPQSPQSPHSMPLLDAASISSLSKDHLKASNAVATFRESRRQSQMSERLSTQQLATSKPSYISNLFRSSRKRSLPFRSRSFQRPLSPVPEVLSLDEELRSRRKSDVILPAARNESEGDETATGSSGEAKQTLSAPPSKKPQKDSELVGGESASDFPLTEDWDDYVLVERVQDMPNFGQRDEDRCDNLDVDPATSSINGRMLDGDSDSPSSDSSEVALHDDATSLPREDLTSSAVRQSPIMNSAADCESQQEDDTLLRTPVRDTLVTPEVFISPKTATAELNFTSVMDMDPEERPIFGSLADHWEAAWATKRPTWDGKGIPNSTNKYREDQKVMFHAAPFEERLAQALATQQDPLPQRRNSFNGRTSRLAASSNDRSLQAH